MAQASPAGAKTIQRNATKLGDVEGYLVAQCVCFGKSLQEISTLQSHKKSIWV